MVLETVMSRKRIPVKTVRSSVSREKIAEKTETVAKRDNDFHREDIEAADLTSVTR